MIKKIYTHLFENGLEYYYIKKKNTTLITIEVWVNIGSINELPHEYGICHMIEHMMFKGSQELATGDLDTLFYMIGAKTNAFTSKDHTVYTFTFPKEQLHFVLSIIYKLFENPRFDEADLVTEKEVVIQEIQLYDDDSSSKLFDEAFYNSHSKYNYQHPILGTKETVLSFTQLQLYYFYKKHYTCNNMKIFIIGDITFKKLHYIMLNSEFASMKNTLPSTLFTPIVEKKTIKKVNYIYNETLNKHFLITYILPACSYDKMNIYKGLNLLLGGGKDSFLVQKLIIELKLVTDIKSFFYGFTHETYFLIYFNPIDLSQIDKIISVIYETIEKIKNNNYSDNEIEKIDNILYFQHQLLLSEQSDDFIQHYAPYAFEKKRNFIHYKKLSITLLKNRINKLAKLFNNKKLIFNALLPYHCNISYNKKDKHVIITQDNTNKTNHEIPNNIIDIVAMENERRIHQTNLSNKYKLTYKKKFPANVYLPKIITLNFTNGLKIQISNEASFNDIIVLLLSLKVKHYNDHDDYLGGIAFLFDWLYEGTKNFPGVLFVETIERYGIEFSISSGCIELKFLKKHLTIAMRLLSDYILFPEFALDRFEMIKMQTLENIKNFMDDAASVGAQYLREIIYQNHPYAKNPSGTLDSINRLTPEYCKELYHRFIVPDESVIFIVGNCHIDEIKDSIEYHFQHWKGVYNEALPFPNIQPAKNNERLSLHIEKDQAVILYGGISVKKYSKEFYYLLLADQLLSGSLTESMHALLFQIRDKSGIFYHITGSLVAGCSHDCGMIIIKAITDPSLVELAIANINNVIDNFITLLSEQDLYIAKRALLLAMAEKNDSKTSIINTMVNAYRFNLTQDIVKNNYDIIKNAPLSEVKTIVAKFFNKDKLNILIVQNILP